MWQDEVIVWEETSHAWDSIGRKTSVSVIEDDLYAKGLVIWKGITLDEFIEKSLSVLESFDGYQDDKGILTGIMLVITAANLFPFHIKIIKDDDVANEFLYLLHKKKGQHYILKNELKESQFNEIETLNILITDLIKKEVLIDSVDRYIVNGKVLNNAHLLSEK